MTFYETAARGTRGGHTLPGYEISDRARPFWVGPTPANRTTAAPGPIREAPATAISPAGTKVRTQPDPQPDDIVDYIGINRDDVATAAVKTADLILGLAVRSLGLDQATKVCWFRPVTGSERGYFQAHRDTLGFAERADVDGYYRVWVRIGQAPMPGFARTIAHELYDAYQRKSGGWPTSLAEKATVEAAADDWGNLVADRFVFATGSGMPIYYA